MLLEVTGFSKHFGGLVALSNVDLNLAEGEIRGIIGPNGSGKSTLFNLISGVYKPEPGGTMYFDGEDVTNLPPHEIANRGIARTFQMLRIFAQMTVLENLLVGHQRHTRYGLASAVIGTSSVWAEERRVRDEMMDLLAFIGLAEYARMPAGELSGGQRRLLALGRAMAMRPKLLMLDEPAAGPVSAQCRQAARDGHGAEAALRPDADHHRAHPQGRDGHLRRSSRVLEHGEKIAEGTPAQVKDDHRVIEAYLGKEMQDAEVRAFLRG